MAAARSLFDLVRRAALRTPNAVALVSPNQPGTFGKLTYAQLMALSSGLAKQLYPAAVKSKGTLVASDLPNTTENLLLQLALSSRQAAYATTKDAQALAALRATHNIVGCVPVTKDSWMYSDSKGDAAAIPCSMLGCDFEAQSAGWLKTNQPEGEDNGGDEVDDGPHAYFNSSTALQSRDVVALGEAAASKLEMAASDKVCVSITLCHSFGIASGVAAVFSRGATLVLPAVGGIRGCGNPSERAESTLQVMAATGATLLLADTHIVKSFPSDVSSKITALRGGIVKTGSGSDFLDENVSVGGVDLFTMGKR